MANGPDWGKHSVIAAWVIGIATVALGVLAYVRPPDPAHPISLDFLSKSIVLPSWLAAIILFAAILATAALVHRHSLKPKSGVASRQRVDAHVPQLQLNGTALEPRSTSPTINYPAKLLLTITNKEDRLVRVLPPKWLTAPGNISVQCGNAVYPNVPYVEAMREFGYAYRLEESVHSWRQNKWRTSKDGKADEQKELYVEPDSTFKIWIGLNPMVPHDVLEKRRAANGLGTLILPVIIDGKQYEWQKEV